ncbi:Protein CYCLOPS [Quillaja saponaria]|uniref:Protein CYCLOPS n=1 Tax=Quillaja saponaria TaxID=32244 RepID=A0AAD7L8U7_QUISA|nr:Protein CYCLOPS [Quillaja saponaria]
MGDVDQISTCVSMLRGTLERKKITFPVEKEAVEGSSNEFYSAHEVMANTNFIEEQGNQIYENPRTLQEASDVQVKDPRVIQTVEGSIDLELDDFVNPTNPILLGTASREPSQSESSAAAPVVSSGFDACDGPSNSSQTLTNCESSQKQLGASRSSENVDKGDATKKRRVERSRKMAEAKERSLTPSPVPSDMQAILKRCENLEKEVRSLKLNLSFMNRKDSEQTKQIEELQKQNEDLVDEKDRLLEEIERIL